MRVPMIALALTAAFVFAGATSPAAPRDSNTVAAPAAVPPPAEADRADTDTSAETIVWYRDPIALALVLTALFAAVDITMMFARLHDHRVGARIR